ncbi:hypothetical protein FJZ26_00730 [Candidatus Parvarchaeota archaeon]|nr:hypothetical protein [Candidatus Parvarchaeota archaeon]
MKTGNESHGKLMRQIIMGGQDGLINVLGIVLGVSTATGDAKLVVISGLASMFAESVAMGCVAYNSSKSFHEYCASKKKHSTSMDAFDSPQREGAVVFASTMAGSLMPLLPFLLARQYIDAPLLTVMSVAVSLLVMAAAGYARARLTKNSVGKSVLEMVGLCTVATVIGFVVGKVLGVVV